MVTALIAPHWLDALAVGTVFLGATIWLVRQLWPGQRSSSSCESECGPCGKKELTRPPDKPSA